MIEQGELIHEIPEIMVGDRQMNLLETKGEASIAFHPQGERYNPYEGQPIFVIDKLNPNRVMKAVIKKIAAERGRRNAKLCITLERVE